MYYIIKVILSSSIPFLKELLMGSEGHQFRDGKKRKGDGSLTQTAFPILFFILVFISTDLLEKKELLDKQTLEMSSLKKELASKDKKLLTLENKYEKVTEQLQKLDTLNYRQELKYTELNEDYTEMKELYKIIFNTHEKLKEKYQQCQVGSPVDSEVDVDDINDRLERLRRGH